MNDYNKNFPLEIRFLLVQFWDFVKWKRKQRAQTRMKKAQEKRILQSRVIKHKSSTTIAIKKKTFDLPKHLPIISKQEKQRKLIIYLKSINRQDKLFLKMSFMIKTSKYEKVFSVQQRIPLNTFWLHFLYNSCILIFQEIMN